MPNAPSPYPASRHWGWARGERFILDSMSMSNQPTIPPPSPPPLSPPSEFISKPEQFEPVLAPTSSLYKQKSWSTDTYRDEAWRNHGLRRTRLSKGITDEDLEELRACIELGFRFDSPDMDQRLSDTFSAYELFYAVNKSYNDAVSDPTSLALPSSSTISDCDTPSPLGSSHTIFGPGENPHNMKTRLRQWAQVVACAVRQSSR